MATALSIVPVWFILSVVVSLTSTTSADAETGVRRVTKSGLVEVDEAERPVKRQSDGSDDDAGAASMEEEQDSPRCQTSQGAIPPNAFATASNPAGGDAALQTYDNVAGYQECALLCASNVKCKTFYHVKDANHPLHKQCTLMRWEGQLKQFTKDDCCDSGFPCSADDLTASLKHENQILRQQEETEMKRLNDALEVRQRSMALRDTEVANDRNEIARLNNALELRQRDLVTKDTEVAKDKSVIKHLNHALGIRQKIFVEKDMQMAAGRVEENRLERERARLENEVQVLNVELQKKSYYVYGLSSAVALATTLLFAFAGYVAWERWVEHGLSSKPKQKSAPSNNAQLIASPR